MEITFSDNGVQLINDELENRNISLLPSIDRATVNSILLIGLSDCQIGWRLV